MLDWTFSRTRPATSNVIIPTRAQFHDHGKWQYPHHFAIMLFISSNVITEYAEFPNRTFEYGAFAFFVVYALIFFAFGLPMVILECQLGQYLGQSSFNIIRHICPAAGGIGIIQLLTIYLQLIKCHVILSTIVNYVFASMVFASPWRICGHQWSSTNCYTKEQDDICLKTNSYFWNNTCYEPISLCETFKMIYVNVTHCSLNETFTYIPDILMSLHATPGYDYFFYIVSFGFMKVAHGLYFISTYSLVWVLTLTSDFNGINKIGVRVAHVIVIIEHLILIFLFVTTLLSSGGFQGVSYAFQVDLDPIANYQTWFFGLREVIENLNLGFSVNTVLASFNELDASLIKPILYSGLCHFASYQLIYSLILYALWGVASVKTQEDISFISKRTIGSLAAIASIPDLYQRHTNPHIGSTLFYLLLTTRCVGANFIALETLVISLGDMSNFCRDQPKTVRLVLSIIGWCLGFFFMAREPYNFILQIFTMVNMDFEIMALIELVVFGLIYGIASDQNNRQFKDLQEMVGWNEYLYLYLRFVYYIVAPIFAVLYIANKYATVILPENPFAFAFVVIYIAKSPLILLIYALKTIYFAYREGKSIKSTITPTSSWYPQPPTNVTDEQLYKPNFEQGSWQYKVAILCNKFGYEI